MQFRTLSPYMQDLAYRKIMQAYEEALLIDCWAIAWGVEIKDLEVSSEYASKLAMMHTWSDILYEDTLTDPIICR